MSSYGSDVLRRIYSNLKGRLLIVQEKLDEYIDSHCPQTLEFIQYRMDSICRDIAHFEYQAVLPDGAVDLVVEAHRLISLEVDKLNSPSRTSEGNATSFTAPIIRQGRRGRPSFLISREQLQFLTDTGFTTRKMAELLQVSQRTVQYRLQEFDISIMASYSHITDDDLNVRVQQILQNLPKAGLKTVQGYLRMRGIRVQRRRLRMSLYHADPSRQALRSITSIRRRCYSVPSPLALWHIDGNHKLIRWRFVVHGGIDGYTRLIVFLRASSNSWAETVLDSFKHAVGTWGLPSRVRADKGGENELVKQFMVNHPARGQNRGSFIQGRSVHNCRIERLWRDVYNAVLSSFYALFFYMEDIGILNWLDEVHLFALHMVYLPRISYMLEVYTDVWNHHSMRTMNDNTPLQMFITGMHAFANGDGIISKEYFENFDEASAQDYGIDLCDYLVSQEGSLVTVPPVQVFLSSHEEMQLFQTVGEISIEDMWNYEDYERCVRALADIIQAR